MSTHSIALVQRDCVMDWMMGVREAGLELRRFSTPDVLLQSTCKSFSVVVLSDFGEGTPAAIEAARKVRAVFPSVPIILIARESSEENAIAALRAGVNDYLKCPLTADQFSQAVTRLLGTAGDAGGDAARRVIYESSAMRSVTDYASKLSLSSSTVLITGETGTGKELVAKMIHSGGARRKKPFVALNCAAIPDSLLESELFGRERGAYTGADTAYEGKLKVGDGGTVFFDEIGDLTACGQAKLLRVLESRHVQRLGSSVEVPLNIRVLAATNQDLSGMVERGLFRRDLYFRLSVARLHIPPLRARREDVQCLLNHFVATFESELGATFPGFASSAMCTLTAYSWPGNVRQLRNVIEELFVRLPDRSVEVKDLPPEIAGTGGEEVPEERDERTKILFALASTQWNKKRAAERLSWSRMTLYRKLTFYRIFEHQQSSSNQGSASEVSSSTVSTPVRVAHPDT